MKKISFFILVLISFNVCLGIQNECGNKEIILPYRIDFFSNNLKEGENQIIYYNSIVKKGIGFYRYNGKYRKQTAFYSEESKDVIHKRKVEDKIIEYIYKDSTNVKIMGEVILNKKYRCLLLSISEVTSIFQKPYYYKILCFDKNDNHLSTINIFEKIDDAATKDWIKERGNPNCTSEIKKSGEIIVTWDEGNDICEQFIELNDHGIFVETKLRFHDRHKYFNDIRNEFREVKNINDVNYYK